jgi:hypothetical protein
LAAYWSVFSRVAVQAACAGASERALGNGLGFVVDRSAACRQVIRSAKGRGKVVLAHLVRGTEQLDDSQSTRPFLIFANHEKVLPVPVGCIRGGHNFSNGTRHGERSHATTGPDQIDFTLDKKSGDRTVSVSGNVTSNTFVAGSGTVQLDTNKQARKLKLVLVDENGALKIDRLELGGDKAP